MNAYLIEIKSKVLTITSNVLYDLASGSLCDFISIIVSLLILL